MADSEGWIGVYVRQTAVVGYTLLISMCAVLGCQQAPAGGSPVAVNTKPYVASQDVPGGEQHEARRSGRNGSHSDEMSGDTPGHFDFYLMNLSWSPEFCAIQGTAPECSTGARRGFILHGLWPQNFDGSYPTFCSHEAGPKHPETNLDITPDLSLLEHEWSKHGTCSGVGPDRFFQMEHQAFSALKIPPQIGELDHEVSMTPAEILGLFQQLNPGYPAGSIVLSCGRNQLTAIEACLDKGLHPIVCQGLRSCRANSVKITPVVSH